ncbi:hypothetical protein CDAR_185971 [Caerostris darwini]|uniref:Uncharacterized protein n=1 Tax=Caerostris darwini TaxID=1538125 RepID=A0AAV4WWW1_9ARAC|nr:hypothetical protein CDAR_185971 [Caerostris darwini]
MDLIKFWKIVLHDLFTSNFCVDHSFQKEKQQIRDSMLIGNPTHDHLAHTSSTLTDEEILELRADSNITLLHLDTYCHKPGNATAEAWQHGMKASSLQVWRRN